MKKRLFVFVVIALIGAGILFTFAACDTGTDDDTGTNTGTSTGGDTGTDTDTDTDDDTGTGGDTGTDDDTGTNTDTGDSSFISVTDITNIPRIALTNDEMELNGVVLPSDATNQTITWSGDSVSGGKFKATTTGDHTVTAVIENGTSESSSYTRNFTIKAYDSPNAKVPGMQGSWTKATSPIMEFGGTDTLTVTDSTWTLFNDEIGMIWCKGIMVADTGKFYIAQMTEGLGLDGVHLVPTHFYDTGSYEIGGNTMTMTSNNPPEIDPMSGTWTKVEE